MAVGWWPLVAVAAAGAALAGDSGERVSRLPLAIGGFPLDDALAAVALAPTTTSAVTRPSGIAAPTHVHRGGVGVKETGGVHWQPHRSENGLISPGQIEHLSATFRIPASEIQTLLEWYQSNRANVSALQQLAGMAADGPVLFPPDMYLEDNATFDGFISSLSQGENFTFEEFLSILSQTRDSVHWFDTSVEVPLVLVYILIMGFGLLSNALICYLVVRQRTLRTIRNMFIMNLAVSDMLMCLFCVPFTLLKLLLKVWPLGEALCRLVPFLQAVNVFASTISITAIALDRYQVILYPCNLKEHHRKLAVMVVIVLIWVCSALIGLPLIIYSSQVDKVYLHFVRFSMCIEQWPSSSGRFAYAATVLVLQFILPIGILLCVHWRISNFLKCRILRNPLTPMEMSRAMKEAKRHRKNSSLLMAIAIMYALCWFPLSLLNFLADFNYQLFMFPNFVLAFAVAHIIAMTSAIINPILYGWFNSNFRREFIKAVFFWRRHDIHDTDPSHGCHEIPEKRKLVQAPTQRIKFTKPMSYKAIQTEVQPVIRDPSLSAGTEALPLGSSDPKVNQAGIY